ncbi:MAG: 1-deoxy-D-xylulose-5-phosphate reductoisomerase [Micavibrio sp.]|nr:1-deoxy-D-xylulose-5-phosphate reductoisomerase [Micavibrio sp.]|tara:strand:- start:378251 stop:379456 length:1206 start_codon:yes stop_codon:yes gene_type:complete
MSRQSLHILGSTGSVGQQTLDLVKLHSDTFEVHTLTAHSNAELLAEQALTHKAKRVVIADEAKYDQLRELLSKTDIDILAGREALINAMETPADIVMGAISGFAGLEPLFMAVQYAKRVAIANKEPLVAAGHLLMDLAGRHETEILPVDSEHNAVFQLFEKENADKVAAITLTASGGPFRDRAPSDIQNATVEEAVAHPNWSMGAKISVDSATLMNKGLEVIEAHVLFDLPLEKIKVVIHPQSTVHAFVTYVDGSVLAHLGAPDMRVPILHALTYPGRADTNAPVLDPVDLSTLSFRPVNPEQFPALGLCYRALREGVGSRIALNAANEVAVQAFLKREIAFGAIVEICARVLDEKPGQDSFESLVSIIKYDKSIRDFTQQLIENEFQQAHDMGSKKESIA